MFYFCRFVKFMRPLLILVLVITLAPIRLFSQVGFTEVYGKVIDAATKEPMDYVNVRYIGSLRAVTTDPKGEYRIRAVEKVDSISFSYLGYKTRTVAIKRGIVQELNIEMGSDEVVLKEVAIKAPKRKKRVIDTTANYVFYQVVKNKKYNREEAIESYRYDGYEKMLISLLNPPERFLNYWLFKPFRFAFRNTDTTEQGSTFIPGLLKESVTEVYYRRNPRTTKKFVKADAMTGVDDPNFGNVADYHFTETDVYDNIYIIAMTSFIAPFASNGILTYNYYLTDTALIDGRISYKLHFVGKVKEDLALKGHAWIDSATWAIRSMTFRPNEKANFNFINDYTIKQDFTYVNEQKWMMSREEINAVGSLFKKRNKMSILVTRTNVRKNIELNPVVPDTVFKGIEERILDVQARERTESFWDSTRLEQLSPQEKMVYFISDTIKTVPAWRTYESLGRFFATAHINAGPIRIGRVLNFVSRNNVEGWRLRFGFETNRNFGERGSPINNFQRTCFFTGYVAYGLTDKRWKGFGMVRITPPAKNDRWQLLTAMYRNDMRIPGQDESQTILTFDNVFTLLSGTVFTRIMRVREFSVAYEKEYFKGFSAITSFNDKMYFEIPGVFDFIRRKGDEDIRLSRFGITEFMLDTRYSYRDQFTSAGPYRFFQTTKYPVFMLRYTLGMVNMQQDHFNYHNLHLTIRQRLFTPIGYTNYIFRASRIFGKVPYTAAYITQGNFGVLLDKFNYNLVREFEFISDQYASFWVEHNFDGFFLNKIPGINKLKLREVITFKSLIGSFNKQNNEALLVPEQLRAPGPVPYIEMAVGIKNIAYMFRVDFLWRVTYRNTPGVPNWGVKFALQPGF